MGTDVQELAARAKRLVLERDYKEAVRACRRLLLSRPGDVDARLLLGRALIATERFDEARVEMMSLIRREPECAMAHRLLGESFLKAKQPKRAEEALRRAVELDPEDEEAQDLLEELSEDPPPTSATVERWFDSAAVATVETPASFFGDDDADRPATSPTQEAPPSIQLDPELAAMAESLAELKAETTAADAAQPESDEFATTTDPETESPPETSPAKPLPAARTSPNGPLAAESTSPTKRKPKRTMMGVAGLSMPFAPDKTAELSLDELEQMEGSGAKSELSAEELLPAQDASTARPATSELDASDLEVVESRSTPKPATSELDASDLEVVESRSTPKPATSELDASDLEALDSGDAFVPLDDSPLDAEATHAVGLAPLPEEATQLRQPGGKDEPTRDVRPPKPSEAPLAPRPVTLPPAPIAPSAGPPGGFGVSPAPSAAGGSAGAPPSAPGPVSPPSPNVMPSPVALPPVAFAPLAGPPASLAGPPAGAPARPPAPVALPTPSAALAGPPAPVATPPAPEMAPAAASPVGFGGGRVVTPTFGVAAAPPAASAPASKPDRPPDFTPGAGPRPSVPHRQPLSTTAAANAVGVRGWIRALRERVSRLEERLPDRRLLPVVLAAPVVLAVLLVATVMAYSDYRDDERIAAAMLQATDDSRDVNLEHAVRLDADEDDGDDESVARRAHLLALIAYESGRSGAEAAELLQGLDDEARATLDARLARAYLGLSAADVSTADTAMAVVSSADDFTGEAGHVRALIALAQGDPAKAVVEARAAVTQRPTSPRHRALLATAQALDGHGEAALVDLRAQPNGTNDPAIRTAEARAALVTGDEEAARGAASMVTGELASVAHARERAWCAWILAQLELANGDMESARRQLTAAKDEAVVGDEALTLALARDLTRAGDARTGKALLDALPDSSARPSERAQTRVVVLLAVGDVAGAQAALAQVGDGARSAYLRGRVAEARDDAMGARRAYEAAMVDPSEGVAARIRLAEMSLRANDAARALSLLEPAIAQAPDDVELIPVAARALLESGNLDRANDMIAAALRARPHAFRVAMTAARIELRRGQPEAAKARLQQLTESHPEDVELWALLGRAAHSAADAEGAKSAFERALTLDQANVDSLLGLLDLAIEARDVSAAHEALDRAATAGVQGRPIELGRARLIVLEGGGEQAIPSLRALRRGSRDPVVYSTLGMADLQAERGREAVRAFSRALRYDANDLDAHIGLARLGIQAGGSRLRRGIARIGTIETLVAHAGNPSRRRAQVATLRAEVLYFGNGDLAGAAQGAQAAIALDPSVSRAHLLLATVRSEQGQSPEAELRAAIAAPAPAPAAFIRLALATHDQAEACQLAARYLQSAPRGSWATDARDIGARCR